MVSASSHGETLACGWPHTFVPPEQKELDLSISMSISHWLWAAPSFFQARWLPLAKGVSLEKSEATNHQQPIQLYLGKMHGLNQGDLARAPITLFCNQGNSNCD